MRRAGISWLAACVAVTGFLALAPSAIASFHLMKIREVDPSSGPANNDGFIELQMFQPGQNLTAGHSVTVYDSTGSIIRTSPLVNVANGANQSRILIAESMVGGTTPDVVDDSLNISALAGAVCFADASPPDCVTWGGGFSEPSNFPDPQAAPAVSPGAGMSLTRLISPGCSTLLEDPDDDEDNSHLEFGHTTPTPQANADSVPETDCVLSVNLAGGGVGSVNSNPAGIMCPSDCSQAYLGDQVVTLTAAATASTGSIFDGWVGCDFVSMSNQCAVRVNVSKAVTASFAPPTSPQLTVGIAGTGSGTVAGGNINCPGTCMDTLTSGASVSITASPATGSTFAGWTGCPSGAGTNPCTYNADIHRTITANFALPAPPPTLYPPVIPTTPATTTPTPPKKCKKGFVKRKGKCRKKRRK